MLDTRGHRHHERKRPDSAINRILLESLLVAWLTPDLDSNIIGSLILQIGTRSDSSFLSTAVGAPIVDKVALPHAVAFLFQSLTTAFDEFAATLFLFGNLKAALVLAS